MNPLSPFRYRWFPVWGFLTLLTPLRAQVMAPSPATPVQLPAFEVTGSHLQRTDYEGPAPVMVLESADITRSGANTVFELFKKMPGNFAQVTNETRSNPARSNAAINLRGLGGNATLVLINGRRAVYDATPTTSPAVNLNAIPLAAVERVEVLKDSASAIYGSDAIAGVVNFILKKEYRGASVTTGYGNTFETDAHERTFNVVAGGASGRFRGLLLFDYFDRAALMNVDRPNHATADQRFRGGVDGRSTTGNPGAVVIVNASGTSPYRAPNVAAATATRPANGRWVIPANQAVNGRPTIAEFIAAGTVGNAGAPRFDFAPEVQLVPPVRRSAMTANFAVTLHPAVELYGEFTFSHLVSTPALASTPILTSNNPQIVVPASHPFNPFGEALVLDYRLTQLGPRVHEQETNTTRTLVGARGTVAERWTWDIGAMRGQSHFVQLGKNFTSSAAIQAALNDPNPATVFNPFAVGNAQNAATIEKLRVVPRQDSHIKTDTLDAKLAGSLFALPGGQVGLAVGGSRTVERYAVDQDAASARGEIPGAAQAAFVPGSRNINAVFAEFSLPLHRRIELQLAARHERYSDFGSTTKPKAGLAFRPREDLLLRGTYAEGFRAPSLEQLYQAASRSFPTLRDTTRYVVTHASEDASATYAQTGGGNPNLQPEESRSWTGGAIYEPRFARGLSVSADFFRIHYLNQVGTVATQTALDNPGLFPGVIVTRDSSTALAGVPNSGRIVSIFNGLQNTGTTKVQGWDFDVKYSWKTKQMGTFDFATGATYLHRFYNRSTPTVAAFDYAGGVNIDDSALPRWRAVGSLFWTKGRYGVGVQNTHIGRYSTRAGAPTASDLPVDTYSTFDVQTSWQAGKKISVVLGVRNVLDEAEPFFNRGGGGIYGFDPSVADTRGRNYYLRVTTKF